MIYLNNAATSFPKPATVLMAVMNALGQIPVEAGRGGVANGVDIPTQCRHEISRLFRIPDANRIILTAGATTALNYVIHGLAHALSATHGITSIYEHNSVLRPLNHLAEMQPFNITYIRWRELSDQARLQSYLNQSPAFMVLNHVSNVTGAILPIISIANQCAENGLPLVIDVSQSAGAIDIDVTAWPENVILVFAGHKGLFGPMGTGGFYLGPAVPLFKPLLQGGTGIRSDRLLQPLELPRYYEAGTMNLPGLAGLTAGLQFIQEIGVSRIGAHKHHLLTRLKAQLDHSPRLTIYEPRQQDYSAGVLAFNIAGWPPADLGILLQDAFGIICRTGLHCAPLIHEEIGTAPAGCVRLSCSWFSTEAEIDAAAEAINQILRRNRCGC